MQVSVTDQCLRIGLKAPLLEIAPHGNHMRLQPGGNGENSKLNTLVPKEYAPPTGRKQVQESRG